MESGILKAETDIIAWKRKREVRRWKQTTRGVEEEIICVELDDFVFFITTIVEQPSNRHCKITFSHDHSMDWCKLDVRRFTVVDIRLGNVRKNISIRD